MFQEACSTCGKVFTKREHLSRHVRVHSRDKPFACPVCARAFSRRDTLLRHSKIHGGASSNSQGLARDAIPGGPSSGASPQPQVDPGESFRSAHIANYGSPTSASNGVQAPTLGPEPSGIFADFQWPSEYDLWLDEGFSFNDLDSPRFDPGDPTTRGHRPRTCTPTQVVTPETTSCKPSLDLSNRWFDCLPPQQLSQYPKASDSQALGTDLHDPLRDGLSHANITRSLWQRSPEFELPPITFLQRCIHNYITKLWSVIPVVHLPTFRPSTANPLLVLSICALGAMLDASPKAIHHAVQIAEGVRHAILASYDTSKLGHSDTLVILQAALLGHTFAVQSPWPAHLRIAQAFHGTLSVAIRFFDKTSSRVAGGSTTLHGQIAAPRPLDECWADWIQEQTRIRLINLLQVHDGELAATLHEPPMIRHSRLQNVTAAHDDLFMARSATVWHSLKSADGEIGTSTPGSLQTASNRLSSGRVAYASIHASLEAIMAKICERDRSDEVVEGDPWHFMDDLMTWLATWADVIRDEDSGGKSIRILWHSCCLYLYCNLDLCERRCGRDGAREAELSKTSISKWMSSPQMQRCLVHAACIRSVMESYRVVDVPAIHIPRAIFQAALIFAVCAMQSDSQSRHTSSSEGVLAFPEISLLHERRLLAEKDWRMLEQALTGDRYEVFAHSMAALLRTLRPWQNAPRFATVLDEILAHAEE